MRIKLLFLSLSLLLVISGVSAQSNSSDEQNKQVIKELDGATWISDINWNPENSTQVEVEIYSKVPKLVGIQEVPDYNGKTGEFEPMQQVTLTSGKNTVQVPVNGRTNLGIAMVSDNNGIFVTHQPDNYPDPKPRDAPFIGLYAAFMTVGTFYGYKKWRTWLLKRGLIEV